MPSARSQAAARTALASSRSLFTLSAKSQTRSENLVERPGQVQCGDLQPLLGVPDTVGSLVRLALSVDQQSARQISAR